MNIKIHKAKERGTGDHGWLKSNFSFSFADYHDKNRMGFGLLRVLNDDTVAPGSGFPMHPHSDMEIVSIVTEGELQHKDSLGNGSVIRPGEVQRMSAGSGITHSEWNPSKTDELKFFQIWIHTGDNGVKPEYEQKSFDFEGRKGELIAIVSGDSSDGGLTFHQDAWIYRGILNKGQNFRYELSNSSNGVMIFVIKGNLVVEGHTLASRDEITATDTDSINIYSETETDLLLFEVPQR
ncbi:MAG: hypothetical protein C0602_06805 [Denitrovibrio sp.]|nr:MAG: hypothetical protein C0602_06805 [Denitrovibrio sp.]